MTGLAVWLCIVGVADVLRTRLSDPDRRRSGVVLGLSVAALVLAAIALRPTAVGWATWLAAAIALVAWQVGTAIGRAGRPGWAVVGFGGLSTGIAVLAAAGDHAGNLDPFAGLLFTGTALAELSMGKVLLAVALVIVQVGTGNVAVRLLLDLVGVPPADNEKKLRGGRILGPLERVFIVVLGLAGQLTAASIVVAAKAVLRFPEVRRSEGRQPADRPSDLMEYFLIGSLTSWLFAVVSFLLLSLA